MNQQLDLNTLMGYMITMVVVVMMMKIVMKALGPAEERPLIYGPRGELLTHSSAYDIEEQRRLGEPRTEEERARVHEEFYGTSKLPPRGTGLIERKESAEGRRLGEPKAEAERREAHERKYGSEELPKRGKGLEEHHSIRGPERQRLVDQYGSWSVGRAESVCPEGDVECVRREASRLMGAYRRGFEA